MAPASPGSVDHTLVDGLVGLQEIARLERQSERLLARQKAAVQRRRSRQPFETRRLPPQPGPQIQAMQLGERSPAALIGDMLAQLPHHQGHAIITGQQLQVADMTRSSSSRPVLGADAATRKAPATAPGSHPGPPAGGCAGPGNPGARARRHRRAHRFGHGADTPHRYRSAGISCRAARCPDGPAVPAAPHACDHVATRARDAADRIRRNCRNVDRVAWHAPARPRRPHAHGFIEPLATVMHTSQDPLAGQGALDEDGLSAGITRHATAIMGQPLNLELMGAFRAGGTVDVRWLSTLLQTGNTGARPSRSPLAEPCHLRSPGRTSRWTGSDPRDRRR